MPSWIIPAHFNTFLFELYLLILYWKQASVSLLLLLYATTANMNMSFFKLSLSKIINTCFDAQSC